MCKIFSSAGQMLSISPIIGTKLYVRNGWSGSFQTHKKRGVQRAKNTLLTLLANSYSQVCCWRNTTIIEM